MRFPKLGAASLLLFFVLALHAGEFGYCSHMEFPDADQTLALLKANGATIVRFNLNWVWIEPKPGVYCFDSYDHFFTLAQKHGIEIEGIFGAVPPKWAKPLSAHQAEYLKYVEAFTRHFKGRLKYVEIVNEANVDIFWGSKPDPEAYAALLKKAYRLIKSIDPNVTVLYSGTAGAPSDFIERTLKTDLTGSVDAFNIHPYSWNIEPELSLTEGIGKLQKLLTKYGFAKTPIWVTEIGASTGTNINSEAFLKAAFAEAKIDPARSGLAILRDDDVGATFLWNNLPGTFGRFARRRWVSTAELKTLDPREYHALLLPAGSVLHVAAPAAITGFLKKGGTVISLDGIPGYFELTPDGKDSFTKRQVDFKNTDAWHLGASAWWTEKEKKVPRNFDYATTDGRFLLCDGKGKFGKKIKIKRFSNRHLSTDGLKKGDTFKPLVFGCCKDYKKPVAGVYHFNSDLKGQFIVSVTQRNRVFHRECVTPDMQARRMGRELLLCRGLGIEKILPYKFRSREHVITREGHFGAVNEDFSPKPALTAYRLVTQLRPEGSTPVKLDHDKLLWRATWQRPDRKYVTALWRVYDSEKVKLSGKVEKAIDYLGNPVWVNPASFPVSDGITYFVGPEPVSFAR